MPFVEMVEDLNRRSRCQINSEEIRNDIEHAMSVYEGEERDNALKQIFFNVFPADARNHERIRMEFYADTMADLSLLDEYITFISPNTFLADYINVISECAKEYDSDYEPPFMLGLQKDEVKDLQMNRLDSYTMYDNSRYTLFTSRGFDLCAKDVENSRFDRHQNQVRYYPDTVGRERLRIQDTHIYKEIVKEELASKSIWWKIRHPIKTYELWSFKRTAEKALRDVHFTADDGVRVTQEFKAERAARYEDIQKVMNGIDKLYDDKEKEQSEPQNNAVAQPEKKIRQAIYVDIPEPTKNSERSQPISNEPNLEKGSININ